MELQEFMTREVITLSQDASLREAGVLFKSKRISGVPVTDGAGKIVGVVTITDMLKVLGKIYSIKEREIKHQSEIKFSEMYEEAKEKARVSDIMTREVYVLNENRSVDEVMRLMMQNNVHTIPITNDEGKLIGIIGKRDLVSACF